MTDNGILGKTDIPAKVFEKGTITVDMFGCAFYRQFKYKMVTHARVFSLKPISPITDNQGLFLSNSLKFLSREFGYENMCSWDKIKSKMLQLPIKNDQIDFDFMESFIGELEAERIAGLSAYLKASGFDNYELSREEKAAFVHLKDVEWGEYRVGDLFSVKTYKKRFDANKVTLLEKGKYPYVVRMSGNNGQKGFINEDEKYLNEGNTLSFGQDTATVFYQEKPYFTGDKIKILKCRQKQFSKKNAQFFVAAITKAFSSFSWGTSSYSIDVIENQFIKLPTKSGKPDYGFMETFISAIQKLVIKDVVLYTDRKLAAAKQITGAD